MANKNYLSETFCILPWTHLFIDTTGDFRACCISAPFSNPHNITEESISEFWNSKDMRALRLALLNGDSPAICDKCWLQEKNGIHNTKRISENTIWKSRIEYDTIINNTTDNGTVEDNIVSLDCRLGNLCNLKCIMCFPGASSKWFEDKELLNKFSNTGTVGVSLEKLNWPELPTLWDYLAINIGNIQKLQFAGGEPLLIKKHFELLRNLIDNNYAKNVSLKYNTNITTLPDNIFELWSYFKDVDVLCSIDATDKLNEYIRFPSKWNDIVQNLKQLDDASDNIKFRIKTSVGALNVKYIPELYKFINAQEYKKMPKIIFDIIRVPECLNMQVLPDTDKQEITEKLQNHLTGEKISNKEYIEEIQFMIFFMNDKSLFDIYYNELIKYITALEHYRGNMYPHKLYRPSK